MGNQAGKVHNSAPARKAELRLRLINELGGPSACRVLETHSGPGLMRKLAYGGVSDWVGLDQDPESPGAIHHDSREIMRAIELGKFNLIDIDAFGSPWEHLWILSARRKMLPGEIVAVALTSGLQGSNAARTQNVRLAGWSKQMASAVGVSGGVPHRLFVGERGANHLAHRLVVSWFSGCEVKLWLAARSRHGGAWYFGVVLQGCAGKL
jgi:hypothetical protein